MTIIENLKNRYATKVFDASKAVSSEDLDYVLEAGNLTATSYGLQPFTFVVVDDATKKQALVEHAYGQGQVAQNGALIVLAVRTDVNTDYITEYTTRIETTRGLPAGTVDSYKDMMVGHLTNISDADRLVWAQKQAYIALGTMMVAAGERGLDNAALEGFSADKFDEILGLGAMNLRSSVLLVLGYRSAEDATAGYAKVRKNISDIVVHI